VAEVAFNYLDENTKAYLLKYLDGMSIEEAALKYCKYASEFTLANNGKPWKYLLVPHNEKSKTINFDLLIAKFS
jgi:type III restriction enzyme